MRKIFLLVLSGFFLLTGCPGTGFKNELKRIQENNMDLPDLRTDYFNAIKFRISELFQNDYNQHYVIQDNAMTKVIWGIEVRFSVELFNPEEAEAFQFAFNEAVDPLNAVHDNYIIRRKASLSNPAVSIKKELGELSRYPGVIQVIHSDQNEVDHALSYFTATLKIDDDYYVFQLIGKKENMGYLYDDFREIIASVTT